jgi:drug/metabolite transporter (DMT)-like permease
LRTAGFGRLRCGATGEVAWNVDDERIARLTLAAFIGVVLFCGANFVAVRFSNHELAPLWGASIRFGGASLVLFAAAWLGHFQLPRGRALLGALIFGVLAFGGSYALVYVAMVRVPAGLASVLMASCPLFTFLLALLQRQETFRWRELFGGMIAVAGIAVMFAGHISAAVPLASLLLQLLGAMVFAEAGIIVKEFPRGHPIGTNAVAMGIGTVILLSISLATREAHVIPRRPATWAAVAYLILLGSCAVYVLYLFVLKRWSASATAYQFVLSPLVAVSLGAWLSHEPVTRPIIIGGALVLGGVYIGAVVPHRTGHPHKIGAEPVLGHHPPTVALPASSAGGAGKEV